MQVGGKGFDGRLDHAAGDNNGGIVGRCRNGRKEFLKTLVPRKRSKVQVELFRFFELQQIGKVFQRHIGAKIDHGDIVFT